MRKRVERRIRAARANEAARIIVASCRAGQRVAKRRERAREPAQHGIRGRTRLRPWGQKETIKLTPAFDKLWRKGNIFRDEYRKLWGGKIPFGLEMKKQGERWSDCDDEPAASRGTKSKGTKGTIGRWVKHKFQSFQHREEGRTWWRLEGSPGSSELWRDDNKGLPKDEPPSDATTHGVADHHAENHGATAVGLDYAHVQPQRTSAHRHQPARSYSGETQTPMQSFGHPTDIIKPTTVQPQDRDSIGENQFEERSGTQITQSATVHGGPGLDVAPDILSSNPWEGQAWSMNFLDPDLQLEWDHSAPAGPQADIEKDQAVLDGNTEAAVQPPIYPILSVSRTPTVPPPPPPTATTLSSQKSDAQAFQASGLASTGIYRSNEEVPIPPSQEQQDGLEQETPDTSVHGGAQSANPAQNSRGGSRHGALVASVRKFLHRAER